MYKLNVNYKLKGTKYKETNWCNLCIHCNTQNRKAEGQIKNVQFLFVLPTEAVWVLLWGRGEGRGKNLWRNKGRWSVEWPWEEQDTSNERDAMVVKAKEEWPFSITKKKNTLKGNVNKPITQDECYKWGGRKRMGDGTRWEWHVTPGVVTMELSIALSRYNIYFPLFLMSLNHFHHQLAHLHMKGYLHTQIARCIYNQI